jgi:2-methylisocitrate lyase-like PEP mutase family enzyme
LIVLDQSQHNKAAKFVALHKAPGAFVIPNAWDAGSARILAALGFEALATTSAGLAFALGRRDAEGLLSRDEALANAAMIVQATDLPVSADLEDGFGPRPEDVAATVQQAAAVGLVGCTIEDTTADQARPIHDFNLSVERIVAAVEAAEALPFSFTLTARAENFLFGRPDLDDTIRRLRAFEDAGADVLYAPGLPDLAAIRTACSAVSRPFNFVAGLAGPRYSVAELAGAGVKRISLGSTLSRAALGALARAAREIRNFGTFDFTDHAMPFAEANALMKPRSEGM